MDAARDDHLPKLITLARAARTHAHAPYSEFAVGAALLTEDGARFQGCNVENAVYGETVCAERVAIWSAVAAGAKRIRALAVATPSGGTPCGACRQVLAEFAGPETPVAVTGPDEGDPVRVFSLAELLPEAFGRHDLRASRPER